MRAADTGWVVDGPKSHRRTIGVFVLRVEEDAAGATFGVDTSAFGSISVFDMGAVLAEGDESDADVLSRAKEACEDAARAAGIAVPR